MRKIPIITDKIYHVFNRGVNKGDIFFDEGDYRRFLAVAAHYRIKRSKFSEDKRLSRLNSDPGSEQAGTQILAYALMPNHFHFLVKQITDGGLTAYIQHLSNSYSHYINIKYKRIGPLFQGRFKAVAVDTDEQLIHVSRYIHLNPLVSKVTVDLNKYKWSSYFSYAGDYEDLICDSKLVLGYFNSKEAYKVFVHDQEDYGRKLEQIKHQILD